MMNPQDICSLACVHIYGEDVSDWGHWEHLENVASTMKSLKLLYKACQNDADAQFELVGRVANGIGLKQDLNMAGKFYRLALRNGFTLAQPKYKSGLTPEEEECHISKIKEFVLQHHYSGRRFKGCRAAYCTFNDPNPLCFEFLPPCSRIDDVVLPLKSGEMVVTEDGSLFIEHNDKGVFYSIDECQGDTLVNASRAIDEYNLQYGGSCRGSEMYELSEEQLDDMLASFESYLASVLENWRNTGIDLQIDERYRDPLIEKIKSAIKPTDKRTSSHCSSLDTDLVKPCDVERLKAFADESDAEACYYLFQMYHSYSVYRSFDKSVVRYIRIAAESGYAPAILPYINVAFLSDDKLWVNSHFWHDGGGYECVDIAQCGSEEGIENMRELMDFCESVSKSHPDCIEPCVDRLKEFAGMHIFEKIDPNVEVDWDTEGQKYEGVLVAKQFVGYANNLPDCLLSPLKESFPNEFEKYS